jgi:cellobiose epimerase
MNSLTEFADKVRTQLLGHILPFWCGPALDHDQGGWMAWLSNDLQPDRAQPKGLIVNARILWAFSAAYRAFPEPIFQQMADRALRIVMNDFWDQDHGGAFWQLDGEGRLRDDSKKTYGQAFYIYALVEHHLAFESSATLERARELFELVEANCYDSLFGGYWEVRRRDWSEAADTRLSTKDMNEKKSMNNHLHVLEAYTCLHQAWPDARVERQLREVTQLFRDKIVDRSTHHFHHFFDETWRPRSDSYTFGHDIEGSWLLCEAAEALNDRVLLRDVEALALTIADAVRREGCDATGGLCYEGRQGIIIDRGKECWPQAEAVVGFLNAYQLSGDSQYLEAGQAIWTYIEEYIVDRVHGEWFWRIDEHGNVDQSLPKVSEWKGPYHGTRACLQALHRIGRIEQATAKTAMIEQSPPLRRTSLN